jgi:predicted amidohydrolase YtcJ
MEMETAVTRMDAISNEGGVLLPEQRISIAQAIEAFTIDAAYVNHQDDRTGSVEVGKLADLVVLSHDYFMVPDEDLKKIRSVLTVVGGRVVHEAL